MNVTSQPVEIPERRTRGDVSANNETSSSNRSSPVVEHFYERYQSFRAAKQAPPIDIDEIKNVFNFFDENHDGLISKEDLRHFMGRLGFRTTDEEITMMVSSVDVNGDGSVDFNEFASLYQSMTNDDILNGGEGEEGDDCEDDMKEAFHVFDKNADGVISPTELQEVLVNLGMNEGHSLSNCERMIQNVDSDGNGVVDFGEFKKMMSGDFGRG